ncbi:hypothetical protein PZB74_01775 [Porifericola rhodea]|uniref:hypothetical protein n=1 Tax=Porifericola rhodea TaxID=930972 RepID=UPI002666DA6B|nr:hypothetical protein [Porifericola rhodea]WKN32082.1 hypothetical protein PZB74_01775 [Porifericola rhodea]
MSLYEMYISGRKSFETELQVFNDQTKRKVLNKLRKERNRMNFLSHITEINFGFFYAQNGALLEYEKKYRVDGKINEPDWTIYLNGQVIIGEVLRLNLIHSEQSIKEFEEQLVNRVKQIKGNYCLQIDYKNQYFLPSDYNLDFIIEELVKWLTEPRSLMDQVVLFDNFSFKIVKVDTALDNIIVSSNVGLINIDKRRLESKNSIFNQKVNKYVDLINSIRLPYIINLYIDPDSGIDEIDVFSFLYGKTIDDRTINSIYTDLNTGLFYSDNKSIKYLSGVLLRYNNTHIYFHNYYKDNKLNFTNRELFLNLKPAQSFSGNTEVGSELGFGNSLQ